MAIPPLKFNSLGVKIGIVLIAVLIVAGGIYMYLSGRKAPSPVEVVKVSPKTSPPKDIPKPLTTPEESQQNIPEEKKVIKDDKVLPPQSETHAVSEEKITPYSPEIKTKKDISCDNILTTVNLKLVKFDNLDQQIIALTQREDRGKNVSKEIVPLFQEIIKISTDVLHAYESCPDSLLFMSDKIPELKDVIKSCQQEVQTYKRGNY